jgi:hypothetical protein
VKKLLGAFDDNGSGAGGDASRDPAGEISEGVGERDSADLFDRVHAFHERCQQKGCVMSVPKRKVGA